MYKHILLFLVIAAACVASQTTPVRKCKNFNEQLFKSVIVKTPKGICTKLPCIIERGTNIATDITFDVKSAVEKMTLKASVTLSGNTISYPIPNADRACDWLTNTFCPIEKDTEAELEFKMTVLKIFPKISAPLTLYIVDQAQKVISCFEVDINVV